MTFTKTLKTFDKDLQGKITIKDDKVIIDASRGGIGNGKYDLGVYKSSDKEIAINFGKNTQPIEELCKAFGLNKCYADSKDGIGNNHAYVHNNVLYFLDKFQPSLVNEQQLNNIVDIDIYTHSSAKSIVLKFLTQNNVDKANAYKVLGICKKWFISPLIYISRVVEVDATGNNKEYHLVNIGHPEFKDKQSYENFCKFIGISQENLPLENGTFVASCEPRIQYGGTFDKEKITMTTTIKIDGKEFKIDEQEIPKNVQGVKKPDEPQHGQYNKFDTGKANISAEERDGKCTINVDFKDTQDLEIFKKTLETFDEDLRKKITITGDKVIIDASRGGIGNGKYDLGVYKSSDKEIAINFGKNKQYIKELCNTLGISTCHADFKDGIGNHHAYIYNNALYFSDKFKPSLVNEQMLDNTANDQKEFNGNVPNTKVNTEPGMLARALASFGSFFNSNKNTVDIDIRQYHGGKSINLKFSTKNNANKALDICKEKKWFDCPVAIDKDTGCSICISRPQFKDKQSYEDFCTFIGISQENLPLKNGTFVASCEPRIQCGGTFDKEKIIITKIDGQEIPKNVQGVKAQNEQQHYQKPLQGQLQGQLQQSQQQMQKPKGQSQHQQQI